MSHTTHPISCKAALFNQDKSRVLIAVYGPEKNIYGLPGGHLEKDESPEQCIARELSEELGLDSSRLRFQQEDFWRHREGKIILCFSAVLDDQVVLSIDPKELSGVIWVDIDDIESGKLELPDYGERVVKISLQK